MNRGAALRQNENDVVPAQIGASIQREMYLYKRQQMSHINADTWYAALDMMGRL